MRWYAGTPTGDNYRQVLAFGTEESPGDPGVSERSVGDLLDPSRPGRIVDVVNAVTRHAGVDAAGWRVDRLVGMVATLEAESRREG